MDRSSHAGDAIGPRVVGGRRYTSPMRYLTQQLSPLVRRVQAVPSTDRTDRLPDPALDAIIKPPYSRDPKPFAGQFFAGYPRSARDFAEVLLPLAPPDRRWRDLVEAMPRVTRVTPVRDWDLIIERGEAARTEGRARLLRDHEDRLGRRRKGPARGGLEPSGLPALPDIEYRLAAAYHARACVALQRGDGVKAREDLDRAVAIDPAPAYLATRGYLRATERDVSGALRDYGTAIGRGSLSGPGGYRSRSPVGGWLPLARAHYCRACLLIEEGDARRALRDLDCALGCIDGHERQHGAPLPETSGSAIAPSRAWIDRAREAALRQLDRRSAPR